MSVYTSLSPFQLKELLKPYQLGKITHYAGISDGIENSNYRLTTTNGEYILTIYEHFKAHELNYFLKLLSFLHQQGMNVPQIIPDSNQQLLTSTQSQKPAAIFHQLPGNSILNPEISHCQQIGTALAQIHITGLNFPLQRPNAHGYHWAQKTGQQLINHLKQTELSANDRNLLSDELLYQKNIWENTLQQSLPQGTIHADLFYDNALFENGQLSGILDFYTACNDSLLYDLAITVNAWCFVSNTPESKVISGLEGAQAMIAAYEQFRPLTKNEHQQWPAMLRAAALRFWLSRLIHRQSTLETELAADNNPDKSPDVLKYLLLKHRDSHFELQ